MSIVRKIEVLHKWLVGRLGPESQFEITSSEDEKALHVVIIMPTQLADDYFRYTGVAFSEVLTAFAEGCFGDLYNGPIGVLPSWGKVLIVSINIFFEPRK